MGASSDQREPEARVKALDERLAARGPHAAPAAIQALLLDQIHQVALHQRLVSAMFTANKLELDIIYCQNLRSLNLSREIFQHHKARMESTTLVGHLDRLETRRTSSAEMKLSRAGYMCSEACHCGLAEGIIPSR